jgi:hypothetical protein
MNPKAERLVQKLLRLGGLQTRTLQIPEILEAVEEHLRAVALVGPKSHFLPIQLSVAVASADLKGIAPFESELRREMHEIVSRLAARPAFKALTPRMEVDLSEAEELLPGSAPRLHATFPKGCRTASWRPTPRTLSGTQVEKKAAETPLFEVVLTAVSGDSTSIQSVFVLCLEPRLPANRVDPDAGDGSLVVNPEGIVEELGTDKPWTRVEAKVTEVDSVVPAELDSSVDLPPDASTSVLYRFYVPGRPEVLWAPQGFLVVGRRSNLSHWVPGNPPQNLSGNHFALMRSQGRTLRITDLGSTNGTFLGGRMLHPFERVAIGVPESVEVGTEGAMRLDLRSLESALTHEPP